MENYFSAADLVKRSAAQIKYLRDRRDKQIKTITEKMQFGQNYQHQVAQKMEAAEEFRTSVTIDDIVIFACHDIVCQDKLVEIKTTQFGTEQWYLESCLLQVAFYKSLVMLSDGYMFTPKFRIKEGYKKECKKINKLIPYYLQFGETKYIVDVKNPSTIVDYFVTKAKATLNSYADARNYDEKHKFKHFKELKRYFTYKTVI